jgi:hypothetical protein
VPLDDVVPPKDTELELKESPAPVQGVSLPTRSTSDENLEDEADELPDWLAGLVKKPEDQTRPFVNAPNEGEEPVEPAELPDWLTGLLPEEEGDVGAGAQNAPQAVHEDDEDEEEMPDWLSGGEEEESLPDWLVEGEEDELPQEFGADEEEEPWYADEVAPEGGEYEGLDEEALPEWLGGVGPEEEPSPSAEPSRERPEALESVVVEAESAPFADEGLPDWLTETATEAPASARQEGGLPGWLQELSDDAVEEEIGPSPGAAEEVPDWLTGAAEEASRPTDVEPVAEEEGGPPPREEEAEEEMPDWLADLEPPEEETEPPSPPEMEEEGEGVPDWFADLTEESAPELEEEEEKVPDWLAEVAPPSEEQPEVEAPVGDEPTEEDGVGLEELTVEEEEPPTPPAPEDAPEADLPDWLLGLVDEEELVEESEAEGAAELEPSEAEVPEVEAPEVKEPEQEAPPEPEEEAPEGIPEWVAEGAAALEGEEDEVLRRAEVELPEEDLEGEGEMPDWLRELETSEGEISPESLEQAEMPDWLRQLRPTQAPPFAAEGEEVAPPEGEEQVEEARLVEAEIPDWVQELRPPEGAVAVDRELERPAEESGPLVGLEDVLPAMALVDMPRGYEPTKRRIADAVIQDAQVWQELLQQPRGRRRTVARERAEDVGWQGTVLRVLVAALLIVVTVGAIFGFVPAQLSQAPQQEGVLPLHAALEGLSEGDTVIFAVEYGPAESVEMGYLADVLLDHLEEREVEVIGVTTLPESTGLLGDRVVIDYQPGGVSGVAQYLSFRSGAGEVDMLLVLSARAERLRWWLEQNAIAPDTLPLGVGTSASTGPLVAPYLTTSAVEGWLMGFPGVAAYIQEEEAPPEAISLRLDALMLTQWMAVGLFLAGTVYYLVAGRRGGSRTR